MEGIKVKVCGMTTPRNVGEVCLSFPDYIGYIFFKESLRYVGDDPDPLLFSMVPANIKKAAVFVNEGIVKMMEIAGKYNIDHIQLHGNEGTGICDELRGNGITVIKAIPGDSNVMADFIRTYSDSVDFFLFDTPVSTFGGSGKKFDWRLLDKINLDIPFFISGGIGPGDAEAIKGLDHSNLFAADINSKFEKSPGIKNSEWIGNFIKEIRDDKKR